MNTKKGIIGITLAIILIASIFAAMISPVAAIEYEIGKSTLTGPGGSVDNSLTYQRGDTVYYRMIFKPMSEPCNLTSLTSVKDVFPDGTEEDLLTTGGISLAQNEQVTWESNWTVPLDWPNETITNDFIIGDTDKNNDPFSSSVSKTSFILADEGGPTAVATVSPSCFEAGGTLITFDGSSSIYGTNPIVSYLWEFSDGLSGSSNDTAVTSRMVNEPLTATLTVSNGHCEDTDTVSVGPCSQCSIRIYGTFGEGAGDDTVEDPETGLPPENKPYSDPVGPFYPQNGQAPREDFITFNPAIMDLQQGKEKVFKRMWYEKEWFVDQNTNGVWDVVMYDGEVMTLNEWLAISAWERPTLREWNGPNLPNHNPDADIYGPAINQEFTYMFLDEETMPIMIGDGCSVLIPMASYEQHNGLDSFDADGDGVSDPVRVESEQTVGIDIDGDGVLEPMDKDTTELNGDESVVLRLEDKSMSVGDTIQFFDHLVTLIDVQSTGTESLAIFDVCDNEGGGSQRCTEDVMMNVYDVKTFYRARPGNLAEKPVFYLRLITADAGSNTATVEIGRMFGQTYANIEANPYRSQKAFMVDGVFYNVVAIRAEDNCIKYITFRQTLPKLPIQLFGKHLECWAPCEILPEMPPFNMDHEIMADVMREWSDEPPASQQEKIGVIEPRPPLEIDYIYEDLEFRYRGELKEIYAEDPPEEGWNLEWYLTIPWQYTELRLPHDDKYLVTLSWYANESEFVLWGSDPNEPDACWTGERVNFWYEDCTGPLYIDDDTSSIRLYGTFGEGAGNQNAVDPYTTLAPENKPYTNPVGPFDPENKQAPVKDFMTFNPAIMEYTHGYPELEFFECPGVIVQIPKEKVFKRMWYEKSWFNDHDSDGEWDVVIEQYNSVTGKWEFEEVMALAEWNALPEYERIINQLRLRVWNGPDQVGWVATADIYGPAINQEFTYMFLDDETMPIMIGTGSSVLIPMASWDAGNGLDSFDADGDGVRDAVLMESEQTVGIDIDGDGVLEPMDEDATGLNGNESVVLRLEDKFMYVGDTIQFFDHLVTLMDVQSTGTESLAIFYVCDNEGGGSQRCSENVVMNINDVQTFYRGRPSNPAEKPVFYIRLITAEAIDNTAIVEIGRMFGQTHANIEANPYRCQKAFIVDDVFYNVAAIMAEDNCIKYITFRQSLPKVPINLFGKYLKWWAPAEILPEMPPFNEVHEILLDVQPIWTRPYSQQDKIGPKMVTAPLEITWLKEDIEPRFQGALKEIYWENESSEDEFWTEEWFWTKPWQYTAFVLPDDQLYLVTLAWYAPESEITIWNNGSNGPASYYTGERVKFWYDAAYSTDLYVNRVGEIPPPPMIWEYYDSAANGGDGDDEIDLAELLNAIFDYSYEVYPFGIDGLLDKDDLCDYLLAFIDQVSGYSVAPSTINDYYDLPSNGGDGDGLVDLQEFAQAMQDFLGGVYPFGPAGMFSYSNLLAYIQDYIELECNGHPSPAKPVITSPLEITTKEVYYVGDTLTANFTITNRGTESITFDVLVVGGRDPAGEVVDFDKAYDITLTPGDSYNYQGSLTLPDKPGIYHFFCAYHTEEHMPGEDDYNWNTNIDVEINGEIVEDFNEAKRYRETDIVVYEEGYIGPAPPPAVWEKIEGPWDSWPVSLLGNWKEPLEIAVNPNNPDEIYVSAILRCSHWGENTGGKLYKSTDGGNSWNPINQGLPGMTEYYWPVRAIAIAPSNPDIIYVGTSALNPYSFPCGATGIYKSTNGGSEWVAVGGPGKYYDVSSMAVDPTNPDIVYIGTVGGGIWRTTDGGASYEKIWNEPIKETFLDVISLAISPSNPNVIYAAAYNHDLLNTWGRGIFIPHHLIKSEDGGNTWKKLRSGFSTPKIEDIVVDDKNADIVYVISGAFDVYKSTDGGKNWYDASGSSGTDPLPNPSSIGPTVGRANSIAMDPQFSNVVYAAHKGEGVYLSPNSGKNWFPIGLQEGHWLKNLIFANNADTRVIYAASIELHKLDISNSVIVVREHSPIELRVYDSQGRVTGLINGEIKEEIPDSAYFNNTAIIFFPNISYCYEVVGTDNGTYGLSMFSVENGTDTDFFITNVSTQTNATHQYLINWTAYSQGEEGVTVRKDEDGDGTFEENITIQPPIANFTYTPENPVINQTITFDASNSTDLDGNITSYKWDFGDETNGTGEKPSHSYSSAGNYSVTLTVRDDDGATKSAFKVVTVSELEDIFDTDSPTNPYPSISGTHNGTITPSCNISVSKLYTYPCAGTGGHTEYSAFSYSNGTLIAEAHWNGYQGDWHNITFNETFTLYENETYNYTIRTGSYPQIIHETPFNATGGTITCTKFTDANGKEYNDWIPAIRLW